MRIKKFLFSLGLLVLCVPKGAYAQNLCANIELIVNTAVDDRCESISSAALDCFKVLDEKMAGAERVRKKSKLSSNSLEALIANYEAGVRSVESYLRELKREDPPCLNQEGEVEVLLEEIQRDLRTADKWAKKK